METISLNNSNEIVNFETIPEEYLEKLRKQKFEEKNLNNLQILETSVPNVVALVSKDVDLTSTTVVEHINDASKMMDGMLGNIENTINLFSFSKICETSVNFHSELTPMEYAKTLKRNRKRGRK